MELDEDDDEGFVDSQFFNRRNSLDSPWGVWGVWSVLKYLYLVLFGHNSYAVHKTVISAAVCGADVDRLRIPFLLSQNYATYGTEHPRLASSMP